MRQIKIFIWVLADIFALGILVVDRAPAQKLPPKKERRRLRGGTASALGALKSFAGITLDGEMFTQKDIAAKDITIINFWTLTCGSCLVELPDLAAFAGALPDNVRMMTVCVDGGGDPEITAEVLQKAGFEGVTIIAGGGDLATLCGNLMYTPTTVVVDSEGNLMGDAIIGAQTDLSGTYLAAVNAALKETGKTEIRLAE